jgi:hypothetical protein
MNVDFYKVNHFNAAPCAKVMTRKLVTISIYWLIIKFTGITCTLDENTAFFNDDFFFNTSFITEEASKYMLNYQ